MLKPISEVITETEGNTAVISVAPEALKYIRCKVEKVFLESASYFGEDEIQSIRSAMDRREEFILQPIHYAANILDPRFCGKNLVEPEILMGEKAIMDIAKYLNVDVTSDLLEFKAREGNTFNKSRSYIWKVDMATNPLAWWKAYGSSRLLSKVASILLSLNVSIAPVERSNKEFSVQKSKKRNRLEDDRASKLTYVAYNLKTQWWSEKAKDYDAHIDFTMKLTI